MGAEGAADVLLHEVELKSTGHGDRGDRMERNRGVRAEGRFLRKNEWSTAPILLANKKL